MTDSEGTNILGDRVEIGSISTRNRIVRAGTAETMADDAGKVTAPLIDLYLELARGAVGLLITGHMFVSPEGRGSAGQLSISHDADVPGLTRLTDSVHALGAPIFAQLAHAGSQSRFEALTPVAPSPVPNPMTGRMPVELSQNRIEAVIEHFGKAARRAVRAGFDGIHIHGANGYLISEFCSPATNQREDAWGGTPARRDSFALHVVRSIQEAVPDGYPVMFKLGAIESVAGGLELSESVARAGVLAGGGVDGFEVSCGLMSRPSDSARLFTGISRRQALRDLVAGPLVVGLEPEATFRQAGRAVKAAVTVPVMVTGGIRSQAVMQSMVSEGDADLIGLARPLIREPALAMSILEGADITPACVSCNLCLDHSGRDPLMCWRYPRSRLVAHYRDRIGRWARRAAR